MFKLGFMGVAALSLGFAATAQGGPTTTPDLVYADVSLSDLESIATDLGHEIEATAVIGDISLRAVDETGLKYLLIGTVCNEGRCKGINMQVRYTYTEPQVWEDINTANVQRAAASTWRSGDIIGVTRYVILDGGMTKENIRVNVRNLLGIAPAAAAIAMGDDPDSN